MKTPAENHQNRKNTDTRQREIVNAAIRILVEEGGFNFTAKNIAAEVGVTSGAIFRHFVSMKEIIDRMVDYVESILTADFPEEITEPIERLKFFYFNRTRTIAAHPRISRLLFSDHLARTAGEAAVNRLKKVRRKSLAYVKGCFQDAAQSGTLAEGVSVEVGVVIVHGAIHSLSHACALIVKADRIEQIAEDVWCTIERLFTVTRKGKESVAGRCGIEFNESSGRN